MAKENEDMRQKISDVEDSIGKNISDVKDAQKCDQEKMENIDMRMNEAHKAHKADMDRMSTDVDMVKQAVKQALFSKRVNAYVTPMPMRDQLHFEAMQYEFKMKAFGLK